MGFLYHLAVVCSETEISDIGKKMKANAGYFDVRDHNDTWIHVWLKKGAMIVLPAGIYHRFTLDSDNYIKVMLFFVSDPVWTPFNRPHDHLPSSKEYLETFGHKKFSDQAVVAAA